MATEPQLIVALEARLDKFERQLREAGLIAEREMAKIEKSVSGRDFVSGFIGGVAGALTAELKQLAAAIPRTIREIGDIQDTAERVSVTTDALQALKFAIIDAGGEVKNIDGALQRFSTNIGKAAEGSSHLAELFKLNNVALKDSVGNFKTQEQLLEDFARLVRNAGSEQERMRLAVEAFGRNDGPRMVKLLEDIANRGMPEIIRATKEAGAVIDKELVKQADAFNDAWDKAIIVIKAKIAGFAGAIIESMREAQGVIEQIDKAAPGGSALQKIIAFLTTTKEAAAAAKKEVSDLNAELSREAGRGRAFSQLNRPETKIPKQETEEARDALDRFDEQLNKHIELLKAEEKTIFSSNVEKEKARQIALLTAAAEKEGKNILEVLNEERLKQITLASELIGSNARIKASLDELNSATKEFGSALAEAFKGMVLEGKKLDEVLQSLAKRMASRAIDKLFDLFFSPQSGQATSLIGSLLKGLTARQAGGPLASGQAAIVGEHGPEIFVPKTSGMVLPNKALRSGGGAVEVRIINNTGQPVAQQEQQGPNGRVLEITVGNLVRDTIRNDLFQGGDVDRAMRSRFGLTPRLA